MIINGQRYEAEPAVEAYVKDLQAENEKLKNELWSEKVKAIHGEARAKDYDKEAQELANDLQVKVQELGKALMEINALKKENAQLEEKYQKATGVIAMYPSANAELVKHGEWIECDNGTFSCSLCQSWIPKEQHYYARYCLHCGEKMDGGADNAE